MAAKKFGKPSKQTMRLAGVVPYTGAVPNRRSAFQQGGTQQKKKGTRKTGSRSTEGFLDARSSMHLTLPRPVAPYTVTRLTQQYEVTGQTSEGTLCIFGPMRQSSGDSPEWKWSNIVGVQAVAMASAIKAVSNTRPFVMDTFAGLLRSGIVPSAQTIQVINTEALQGTSGLAMGAVSPQILRIANSTDSWKQLFSELTSFSQPRLMSAPKLALRGVMSHCVPADMSELADFASPGEMSGTDFTWDGSYGLKFSGMLPVWYYVPAGHTLTFIVTVELRTRFEPGNPATSGHEYHRPASLSTWDNVMRTASNTAYAVKDIVETVAAAGNAMRAAGAARALPAIVD